MSANHDHIALLQELITSCRDGQIGYRDAAAHVRDPELKKIFDERSLERAQFAGDLEEAAERLGKSDPKRTGSIGGALQRAWFDLSAGVLGGGDVSIVEGVESRESEAMNLYRRIVPELPADIRETAERQLQSITAAHAHIGKIHLRWKGAMVL